MLKHAGMEGVVPVSARARGSWWRLVGLALLMAGATILAGFTSLMWLNAVTWTMWDAPGDPPLWLDALSLALVALLATIPGAVVGLAAGLRRWWVVAAMAMSALVGVGAPALLVLTPVGDASLAVAIPGMVAGALLAVALADAVDGSGHGPRVIAAERPLRSRQGRVLAGVCGGWARAHGQEPARVRLLVVLIGVVLAVALPPMLLALVGYYVFAWLTWPREPAPTPTSSGSLGPPAGIAGG